jgi:HD superfamily phosphohydrolase
LSGFRPQRIRDPLHNLIEFGSDQFEHTLWRVIQTPPLQRLRRIRQLGFSEFVFPGATHTRFAHSIGVFHVARQLMGVIERYIRADSNRQYRAHQAQVALAAALVHDVGHGMFSHAFEGVGKKLNLPMARHESVSEQLIQNSEITDAFGELGGGFANDVASVIKAGKPGNLYDSVVSSQFDADRLDYMRRDRMMTGVESSGIDATWLLANLEVASVQTGADADAVGSIETLVLGPKTFHVAENYVLALFQLYPNVYFHKATKAAERVFASLILRLVELVRDGSGDRTGLPNRHPIRRFAADPEKLENALGLDDTVFWGALPMMVEADDAVIADYARRLWCRDLPKCVDVRQWFEQEIPPIRNADKKERAERGAKILFHCDNVIAAFDEWASNRTGPERATFIDQDRRTPYKKFQDSQSLLNQILIRAGKDTVDMAEISPVVASAETFEVCRVYVTAGDTEAKCMIENILRTQGRG